MADLRHNKFFIMEERKYILITGSSSGMGEEMAVQFSKDFNIILNGRDTQRLKGVYSRLDEGDHLIWQYDLSEVHNIEQSLASLITEHDIKIAFFVHSAGFMKMYPVRMLNADLFNDSYNINVVSTALITKILVSRINQKALESAVFISSNISNFGAKAFSVYGSAKAGLDGLMRSLAVELAPKVRFNSVLPGSVRTRMTEHIYENQELINRIATTYPLGLGFTSDIYHAVKFLLSDDARWITGQQLTIDGGRTVDITG